MTEFKESSMKKMTTYTSNVSNKGLRWNIHGTYGRVASNFWPFVVDRRHVLCLAPATRRARAMHNGRAIRAK